VREGIEAIVLVTVNPNRTLWEALLPEECLGMPAELVAVDRLLDDPVFFDPYRPHFSALLGRPSVPLETYLRLMFLKSRHRLSFEAVVREAADSLSWRRFCRVPLGERMPHSTTLMKTTKRCGEDVVAALNEALLAKAVAARVVKSDKIRADTTVVEANVAYPTDSGLLARGVTRLAGLVKALQGMGLATRTTARDRTRAMRRRAHNIGAWLRRRTDDAKDEVKAINAEMADIADAALEEARRVALNAARSLRRAGAGASGKALALVADLERTADLLERVVAQSRLRLSGTTPDGSTRIVSLHDPDARPIAKGRIGKPVEFGYKAQVIDNVDGIVLDYAVYMGNPGDAGLLAPAIGRVKARLGRAPRAATADRGYANSKTEAALEALGVKTVVIPRTGRPGAARQAVERRRGFRRLVKWRTGCEGRISHLKHGYGWNRTFFDGLAGTETWCGLGILAHNSVKIAALIEANPHDPARTPNQPRVRGRPPDRKTNAPAPDPLSPM
jgi:IS5 family transposase